MRPQAVRRRLGLVHHPGPQAWLEGLAGALGARADVDLTVATSSDRPFDPFDDDGVMYVGVPVPPAPGTRVARVAEGWRHRMAPAATLAAAADIVVDRRPDIVHVQGTEAPFGLLAAAVAPTPLVVSLQGILQAYERLYFAGRSPADVLRLVASGDFLKGYGLIHRYLLLRRQASRERTIMRTARWFIGRTGWDRRVLETLAPSAAYYHCDEMMRAEFYGAEWLPAQPGGATIYTTASALMGKGTECLLGALAMLRRRGVAGLRLRVAGIHPGSELDRLYRRAAQRLGVAPCVDWLGRLAAADIVGELQAADVFAYPSHVDNSPNAVVEAMLVGAPLVASRVGGIPTLVEDGEEGLLVPRGDPEALAGAIERLLTDRALAARLGAAARRRALARNDPGRIVARTLEIYRDIISQARTGGTVHGDPS